MEKKITLKEICGELEKEIDYIFERKMELLEAGTLEILLATFVMIKEEMVSSLKELQNALIDERASVKNKIKNNPTINNFQELAKLEKIIKRVN